MWSHNKWICGAKLTAFEGEFLSKIWGDSFSWLSIVKTITREFLNERKGSFKRFTDNIHRFQFYPSPPESCEGVCWGGLSGRPGAPGTPSLGPHLLCSSERGEAGGEAGVGGRWLWLQMDSVRLPMRDLRQDHWLSGSFMCGKIGTQWSRHKPWVSSIGLGMWWMLKSS